MPLENKYQAICQELKRRIIEGVYTEKLPSRRQLMLEFEVSSRTLHKVFCELKLSGLIAPTHSGTAVNPVAYNSPVKSKLVLVSPDPGDFTGVTPTSKRIIELAEQDGFQLLKCPTCYGGDEDPAIRFFQDAVLSANDGVIFINSTFIAPLGEYLKARNIPFVSGNRPSAGVDINWVDWNHIELFDDVLSQLVSRGVRRIDFFMPDYKPGLALSNHEQVMADFRAVKKSYMLYQPELDEFDTATLGSIEEYADFLATLHHPLDVVCVSVHYQDELSAALRQRGLSNTRLVTFNTETNSGDDSRVHCLYTAQACAKLAGKIWKLFQHVRRCPNALTQGLKQRCEVKYSREFKKMKFPLK